MPISSRIRRAARGAPACAAAGLGLALAAPAFADDAAPSADDVQQVVIAATRVPTPELEVASSVTVITAADIAARQERTIADVLKDVPGLNVVQTGGPGGVTSVFIRGTNSNHTKVLIDGIDISDPSNSTGAFDFGQLLTQDFERIEVLRGPQSGLYGSDAIGGVINIVTKSGSGPAQFTGGLEAGTFDTFNQAGGVSGSAGGFHYATFAEHFHAGSVPVTPPDLLLPGEARNNDYDDNLTLSTKLGYDVTKDLGVGLVARYSDIHVHTTGEDYEFVPPYAGYPAAQQTTAATDEYFTRLTAHLVSAGGAFEQTLGLGFSHLRTATDQPQLPQSLNTGERSQADWQGIGHLLPTGTLVLGVQYERDQVNQPVSADDHTSSGYAELQSQLGAHLYSALNVRYDDNSLFGGKVTWRFAPAWVIQETDTKLKGSVGTGYKAPTLSELYQSFPPYFYANPNLQPESSTGWDAGFEQGLFHSTLRFGATYFHNYIHDLIETDITGTTYANVGLATTQGVESFIALQPGAQLSLRGDWTWTEATDDVTGQQLLRRPKNRGTLIASWQASRAWRLDLDAQWTGPSVDGNRDFSIPRLDAPGYGTVNIATSYQLNAHLTVFGRIDNALDRRYQQPVGFLQPGTGCYAGVKLTL